METKRRAASIPTRVHLCNKFKAALKALIHKGERDKLTHAELLDAKTRIINGDGISIREGDWQRLTVADIAEILGYWQGMSDMLSDSMVFGYVINEKFYSCSDVRDQVDGVDYPHCNNDNGHCVWPTTYLPNRSEYKIWL